MTQTVNTVKTVNTVFQKLQLSQLKSPTLQYEMHIHFRAETEHSSSKESVDVVQILEGRAKGIH